jgi:hypothetical protein
MESNIQQMERISKIAYGRISVSEDSPVFNLFAERREVCKNIIKTTTEMNTAYLLDYLEKVEGEIKLYLWLS